MPMFSNQRIGLFAAWAAALFGSLQIHHASDRLGHAICGPWGCGAPVAALLGYHTFWLVLIVPAAMIAGQHFPPRMVHRLGKMLTAIGIVGVVVLIAVDGAQYLQTLGSPKYLVQRGLFRLITFVDVPLVQLGMAGLLLRRCRRGSEQFGDSADEAFAL